MFVAMEQTNKQTNVLIAIKLQPDGRDKFHWTSEQFVITCQNNNNIKNGEYKFL